MKKLGIIQKIAGTIGVFLLFIVPTFAGFGVSPTNVYNEYLKPGSKFERTVTLSRSDPYEDLEIIVEPSLGEIDAWFTYEPSLRFDFPKGETRKSFKIIVNVPEDAQYKEYEGVIRVKAIPKGQDVQGVAIVKGARLEVDLTTTKTNISQLNITSLKMLDAKDGDPLKLEVVGENVGNVEVYPTAKIVIKNLLMEDLEELTDSDIGSIKPNETTTLYGEFKSALPIGEYFADAYVYLGKDVIRKERVVFRIVDETTKDVSENSNSIGQVITNTFNVVKDNALYAFLGLLVALVSYYLMRKLWEKKGMQPKKDKVWAYLFGVNQVSRVFMSFVYALIFALGAWYLTVKAFVPNEEVILPQDNREIQIAIPLQVGPGVQGARDETEEPGKPTVVGQKDDSGKLKYPIHQEMSITSKVIYYAQEGETFTVVEERDGWYLIKLKDGSTGWLEKTLVKEETENN